MRVHVTEGRREGREGERREGKLEGKEEEARQIGGKERGTREVRARAETRRRRQQGKEGKRESRTERKARKREREGREGKARERMERGLREGRRERGKDQTFNTRHSCSPVALSVVTYFFKLLRGCARFSTMYVNPHVSSACFSSQGANFKPARPWIRNAGEVAELILATSAAVEPFKERLNQLGGLLDTTHREPFASFQGGADH